MEGKDGHWKVKLVVEGQGREGKGKISGGRKGERAKRRRGR